MPVETKISQEFGSHSGSDARKRRWADRLYSDPPLDFLCLLPTPEPLVSTHQARFRYLALFQPENKSPPTDAEESGKLETGQEIWFEEFPFRHLAPQPPRLLHHHLPPGRTRHGDIRTDSNRLPGAA